MPTYEYQCDHCGHTFSAQRRFGDPPLERCPQCGARPRKLVSTPAIVFKGSGWHINDYRKKSSESAGTAGDGAKEAKPSEGGEKGGGSKGGDKGAASKDAASKDAPSKDAGAKDTTKGGTTGTSAKPETS